MKLQRFIFSLLTVIYTAVPSLATATDAQSSATALPYWHRFELHPRISQAVKPQLNSWTKHLYAEVLTAENLMTSVPKGIEHFCPKFASLDRHDRAIFWSRLISVIAAFESAFDPTATYREPSMDEVTSTGLLQLSPLSTMNPGYNCDMIGELATFVNSDASDKLKNPKLNLTCGVKIVDYWIGKDQTMVEAVRNTDGNFKWKGLARYWGTFRHSHIRDAEQLFWNRIKLRQPQFRQEPQKARFEKEHALIGILRVANQTDVCF